MKAIKSTKTNSALDFLLTLKLVDSARKSLRKIGFQSMNQSEASRSQKVVTGSRLAFLTPKDVHDNKVTTKPSNGMLWGYYPQSGP